MRVSSQVPSQDRQVPSQVPSQCRQVQVKLQVLNFKFQVPNKSLVLFAQTSVYVEMTTVKLKL